MESFQEPSGPDSGIGAAGMPNIEVSGLALSNREGLNQERSNQEISSDSGVSPLGIPVMIRVNAVERELELAEARQQLLKRRIEAIEFTTSREAAEVRLKVAQFEQHSPAELASLYEKLQSEVSRLERGAKRDRVASTLITGVTFLVLLVNTAMLVWIIAGVRH